MFVEVLMSDTQRSKIIGEVMAALKSAAILEGKAFDDGVWFTLAFMSDKSLLKTAKLIRAC
jgi:hypothetical protein